MARSGKLLFALGSISLLAFAAACSKPVTKALPSGTMNILGPIPAFEPNALPLDWVVEGKPGRGQLTVVEQDGVPALKVINGQHSFVAVKPTQASLLATPYLSWAWNMDPQPSGVHPVRLVVGFHGGNPKPHGQSGAALVWSGDALPPPRPGGGHHLGRIGLAAGRHHQTEIVNAPPGRFALYGQGRARECRVLVAGNRRPVGHLPAGMARG
jgi:hypothetical protein